MLQENSPKKIATCKKIKRKTENTTFSTLIKSNDELAKALKEVLTNKTKYDIDSNFKLINGNINKGEIINSIPLYMIPLL